MNHPDASELLAAARETLMEDVFPAVPENLHYEIRMIARAMGIAAREAKQREQASHHEVSFCSELFPESVFVGTTSQEEARRVMARAIRAGQFDGEAAGANLHEILRQIVHNALMISNPGVARIDEGRDS